MLLKGWATFFPHRHEVQDVLHSITKRLRSLEVFWLCKQLLEENCSSSQLLKCFCPWCRQCHNLSSCLWYLPFLLKDFGLGKSQQSYHFHVSLLLNSSGKMKEGSFKNGSRETSERKAFPFRKTSPEKLCPQLRIEVDFLFCALKKKEKLSQWYKRMLMMILRFAHRLFNTPNTQPTLSFTTQSIISPTKENIPRK